MSIYVKDFVGQCSQCRAAFKRPVEDDTPADFCQACWRDYERNDEKRGGEHE